MTCRSSLPAPILASLLPLNDPPARRRFPWVSVFIWSCVTPVAALFFVVIADMEWW